LRAYWNGDGMKRGSFVSVASWCDFQSQAKWQRSEIGTDCS